MTESKNTLNSYTRHIRRGGIFVLTTPLVFSLVMLIILFLFGFTPLLTKPSLFARVLFFLILIPTLIYAFVLRLVSKFLPKITENMNRIHETKNPPDTDEKVIRDAEYTQE